MPSLAYFITLGANLQREGATAHDPTRRIIRIDAAALRWEQGDLLFFDDENHLIRAIAAGSWSTVVRHDHCDERSQFTLAG